MMAQRYLVLRERNRIHIPVTHQRRHTLRDGRRGETRDVWTTWAAMCVILR